MIRQRLLLALIPILLHVSAASATDWILVPAASQLQFVATYQNQQVPGVFRRFDVHVALNPGAPSSNRLDVSVFLESADMNSADINHTIVKPEWFHAARFPSAKFESTEIIADGENHFLAKGTLSLKGMQRKIVVPFSWRETGQSADMKGELVLNRADFGIGTGEWAAGNPIGLNVIVRFILKLGKAG
jgi:polyisoprenoid-binding protein YceI